MLPLCDPGRAGRAVPCFSGNRQGTRNPLEAPCLTTPPHRPWRSGHGTRPPGPQKRGQSVVPNGNLGETEPPPEVLDNLGCPDLSAPIESCQLLLYPVLPYRLAELAGAKRRSSCFGLAQIAAIAPLPARAFMPVRERKNNSHSQQQWLQCLCIHVLYAWNACVPAT